jgi:hypothetical protein
VSLNPIDAISAMVAPVVLLTVGSLISNGMLLVYNRINERLRAMTRERLDLLTGPGGDIADASSVPSMSQERLAELRVQVPILTRLHRLTRRAVLVIYLGICVLGVSIIFIAIAVGENADVIARVALAFVLAGTVIMIVGICVAGVTLLKSADAVMYAVERTSSLG